MSWMGILVCHDREIYIRVISQPAISKIVPQDVKFTVNAGQYVADISQLHVG